MPILIRVDAGFFDQKLFEGFEKSKIGYISSGYIYEELKTLAEKAETGRWRQYRNHRQVWDYLELGDRRGAGEAFRGSVPQVGPPSFGDFSLAPISHLSPPQKTCPVANHSCWPA